MIEWIAEYTVLLSVLGVLFSGVGTAFIVYLVRKPDKQKRRTTTVNNSDGKSDDIVVKIPKGVEKIELIIKRKSSSSSP